MRAPILVTIIVALHVLAIGSFIFLQGCGTRSPLPTKAPDIVMPPTQREAPPAVKKNVQKRTVRHTSRTSDRIKSAPITVPPSRRTTVPKISGETYTVQKGDSLSKIASKMGVNAGDLAAANNISDPNKIRVGQKLMLPSGASNTISSGGTKTTVAKTTRTSTSSNKITVPEGGTEYVVLSGDSLSRIASRHGIKLADLRKANSQLTSDALKIGQKLAIPGSKGSANSVSSSSDTASKKKTSESSDSSTTVIEKTTKTTTTKVEDAASGTSTTIEKAADTLADESFYYNIAESETLDDIAKYFLVSKDDILKANGIGDEKDVKSGQRIKIPPSVY